MKEWLSSRTFHHSSFDNIKELLAIKEKKGQKISLCLPTLNEEKTIGKEIITLKSELMNRYPLLDELAIIDSGSTDKTCEIAASFGADVYVSRDILPSVGEKKGKGENLWKAIYQLKGDIIVYIDADIANIRPHFAYGLIGPMLMYDEVKYVKAFYDRPLNISNTVRIAGGGRVTEILIRPLFSLFFPELTAFIQPLSGEYAARRDVLEKIPFPIGYGVETSHLIDIYDEYGLKAFAQVDLNQRIHRNQTTHQLGKMSFGILQSFFNRIDKRLGGAFSNAEMEKIFRQFTCKDGVYEQVEHIICEEERPPMLEIPEYREKFHIQK
ncbi:MAG TPA: glucosyl-3-phosphoglycerate synthase [Lentisphaeria bacterium]|nr:MAG: glucosyl-3-phosphoglycerate synthase [Lentisphaerae bacterium GWF2_38_69]HBM14885.1 glucosyl-3-phosphoglycerate synthase [Lentisphaeria bacterium]